MKHSYNCYHHSNILTNSIPMIKKQYLIIKPILLMMSHLHKTNFKGFSPYEKTRAIPLSISEEMQGKHKGLFLLLMTYLIGMLFKARLSAQSSRVFRVFEGGQSSFFTSSFRFLRLSLVMLCMALGLTLNAFTAVDEVMPTGSFVVNLGIMPQNAQNGLKPYGLVYELVHKYKVPVKWVISPTKGKDGVDFSHNGVDYKGGAFVIPKEYRSALINARIAYWQSLGVLGETTNSAITVPVYQTLYNMPRWTLDTDNGRIAEEYLENAGIPATDYTFRLPTALSGCDDIFVLPHADPAWSTHGNLHSWNDTHKGAIWSGCHAVSVLENMFNPTASSQQTNFLMTNGTTPGTAAVDYSNHADGTAPYNYAYPNDPVMQFMGYPDDAFNNGSERVYLPAVNWRSSTKIAAWDPTHVNVPGISPGEAATLAYGQGMGDAARGKVLYAAGHSHNNNKGDEADVAMQRVFMNFSFWATQDKKFDVALSGIPTILEGTQNYNFLANVISNLPASTYTYEWTSSAGGTFSDPTIANPSFTAPNVSVNTPCIIDCKVVDICGRVSFYSFISTLRPTTVSLPPDTDGDGIDDKDDIDDDNDGVLDSTEQLCGLSGSWTQVSAGVWEAPLSSGYKTRVTLGNYNQFWDGASSNQNVANFNRSCTGVTSDFGTIINTNMPALRLNAGNGSGSATNATLTVEFLTTANVPVFVQDPKFHLAGIGGSDGNLVTSSRWTLQTGSFEMLSSDGKITATPNTFVHSNLTLNNGSGVSNCSSGEGSGTFKILGSHSSYVFDVQMLGSDGLPANTGSTTWDQFDLVFEDCIVLNTDGDALANHLDPDSDNDGCSDARESGATLNKTANFAFAAPYGTNGLADAKETAVDNGIINYTSTYSEAINSAINTCSNVPTAALDTAFGVINKAITVRVIENDKFGANGPNASAITITQSAAHGTAVVNNNGTPTNPTDDYITYTPNANYIGQDTVIYSICDLDGDCSTAIVRLTIESACENILSNGGFEQVPNNFTFPTAFENVPSYGVASNAADNRFSSQWVAATDVATRKVWLLNDTANVVNNPQGYKFAYVKGQYDCAQFCDVTQPNCDWTNLLGETLINGMTYEISFYAASWNEMISSSGAGVPTGAGAQGATNIVVDLDLQSGAQQTSPLIPLPASTSFSNLNWRRYTYTFTYNAANPVTSIYISQEGATGFFLDDVKLRKVFAASVDQLLCNVTSTSVSITPNVNVGLWTVASGSPAGAFIVNESNGTTVINSLVPGTYNFVKEINGCRDTVQVINRPETNPGTGSTTTVNVTSTVAINLADLLTGEDAGGTWSRTSGTGGTFNAMAGTFVPTNAVNSVFTYTKIGVAPCSTATADVTVNINNTPDAVNDVVATPLLEDAANGTVNIITNDTDPDGNPSVPTNGVGQFTIDMDPSVPGIDATFTNADGVWSYDASTGIVTFDPALNFSGVATMQYELCDPMGLCDQASITFTVNEDTDGDGIINYVDIDDDNDGILDATEGGQVCASTVAVSMNTKPYVFNEKLNVDTIQTPVLVDSLIFGSLNFTGSLTGTTTWNFGSDTGGNAPPNQSGGVQIKNNSVPTVGHYIYMQPIRTNTSSLTGANTTNYATYELNFTTPVTDLSFISAGLNNSDTYEIYAFDGATAIPLNASNLSAFSPSTGWTVYDLGNAMKVVGDNTAGGTDVSTNIFTTTISQSVTRIEIRSYKNSTGDFNTTGTVTTALTSFNYCTVAPFLDTDTDGTPNFLDSDSDNDTCSDALESGATTDVTANYAFTGAVGVNGFVDSKETAIDNGVINYTSTYINATNNAFKACIPSAPVATNDNETTSEETPLSNSVASNATDVDGNLNPNSFVIIDAPLHGTIVLNNDGSYTYTPNLNFNGVDSVHYQVCDLGTPSLCDTATIFVTVTAVNDAPVAGNQTNTTPESTLVSGSVTTLTSDIDGNLNPNSFTVVTTTPNGTFTLNATGSYTYLPNVNFTGVDSATYQVCDLGTPALCATAVVKINVTPICPGNIVLNNTFETGVNATTFSFAGGLAAITDAGGNSINNWSKETGNGDNWRVNSPAALSGSNYVYLYSTALAGTSDACMSQMNVTMKPNTTYEFCVHSADAKADGLASEMDIEVQEMDVNGSNSVPFHFQSNVVPENPNWSRTALTTIPWKEYCYKFTTNALTTQAKIWLSASSFNGTDTSFVVIDDACLRISNNPPVAVNDTPNVNEEGTLNSTVASNDTDADGNINTTGFTQLDNPLHGTIVFNPDGSYTYTPTANFNGIDSVHYQVCDLGTPALCSTATLIITVNPTNDLPLANTEGVTVLEDAVAITITVLTNDDFGGDGANTSAITITQQPTNGVASVDNNGTPSNPTDDRVIFTPNANFNGTDNLIYRIEDANGDFDTAIVYLTVTAVNDKPVSGDDFIATPQDTPVSGVVTGNDSDVDSNLDPNSYVAIDAPMQGTIVFNPNGSYTYTPNANYSGTDSIHYQVCDLGTPALCDTATVYLNVNFVNYAPVATNDVETATEETPLVNSVATNVTDQNNNVNPSSFVTIDVPINGTIVMNPNGSYTYTPNLNFNGVDSVHYQVCDFLGLCDTATIIVTVSSVNDAPIASNVPVTTSEESALNSTVVGSSTDVDNNINPNGYTLTDAPTNGTIVMNPNGTFTYTPNLNFNGIDSVHYQVCDLGMPVLCSTATLIITVTPVNDLPLANTEGVTILEDALPTTINILTNDDFGGDGPNNAAITITQAPTNGVATVDNNGTPTNPTDDRIVYTPNANFNGNDNFIYRIEDANGDFDTAIVRIRITAVNDRPTANVDGATMSEDDPDLTIDVLLNDDFGGDGPISASINITRQPVNGTASVDNNGTANNPTDDRIIYTPDPNYNGVDSFIYRIGDANADYDTAIVYINVTPVNDLPLAETEGVTIAEDAPTTSIDIITNDDFGGDGPSSEDVAITTVPANGTVSVNDNGTANDPTDDTIDYTPNANFNGTDSFIYRIEDANGDFDTAIVYITINAVNDKPVAGDDFIATPQATAVTAVVTANDSDVDSNLDPNSYVAIDAPTQGTIVFNPNGSYTYTPNATFSGTDSISYQVCDLGTPALCDTAKVYFFVNFVNHAPVATNDVETTTEETPLVDSVTTNVTDQDNNLNPTSFVTIDAPTNGTIVMNPNGSYTYTPNLNFNGVDSVHYQVCDFLGLCDTATIIVTVSSVNDAPIASNVPVTTSEESALNSTVVGSSTDVDNNINPNGYTLTDAPTNGTIVMNPNGTFTYTPNSNFNGIDSVHYQVCDLGMPVLCSTATLIITVTPVNDLPLANTEGVTILEDALATTINVLTNDDFGGDGANNAAITITQAPTNGVVTVDNNGTPTNPTDDRIVYTPNANFNGNDNFIYRIEDANGDFDTAIVTIRITAQNDLPTAMRDSVTTSEDATVTGTVATNDFDVDGNLNPNSFTLTTLPTRGTIVLNPDGTYTYTPTVGYFGTDSVEYQVCDLTGLCDKEWLIITINFVNDAPVATNDVVNATEDTPLSNSVATNATDVDGDLNPDSFVAIDAPVNGTIVMNPNGTYTYTPNLNFNGVDSVHYQVCDLSTPSLCDTATIIITVNAVNDKPVATNDVVTATEDTPLNDSVVTNATDGDNNLDPNSFVLIDAPTNGTLVLNPNGSYTYTPNANFNGLDSVHYQVCDLSTPALCDTALIIVNISNVNDTPRANVDQSTVLVNSMNTINVLINDMDVDTVLTNTNTTITIEDAPNYGVAVVNPDGTILYTPNANYVGLDTLIYRLCDNGTPQLCDTAIVFITVSATNNAPVANVDGITTTEDATVVSIPVLTNDVDDQILTATNITITDAPNNGTVVINPNGTIGYTPNADYNGRDTLIYSICDNGTPALCDTAIVFIDITPVNDAPVAVNDVVSGPEDNDITNTVATNDTDKDPNLNPVSFVTIDNPTHGTIVMNPNGSYTYTPSTNFNGVDSVHYKVCDTEGVCDTATLIITITPVNDKPLAVDDTNTTAMDSPIGSTVATNDFDIDGNLDPNSFVKIGDVLHGTITINPNGSYNYTPTVGYVGKDSVQYQVCDLGTPSLCDTAWLVINVTPVVIGNRQPVATDELTVTDANVVVNGSLTDRVTDPDSNLDNNSFTIVGTPVNGTITINPNGSYIYTPNANYVGEDSVQYSVCDLGSPSLCDTAWLLFVIDQANRAPVASNDNVTTAMNNAYSSSLTNRVSDPDGNLNPNSFTQVTNAIHGSMTINPNGSYTYIPTVGFIGKDSVQYSVCDLGTPSLCDTAWIVITILDAKPIAVDDAYTTNGNTTVGFKVTTNDDPKGTIASVNVITAPKNGSLNFVGLDSIRFTPFNGYCGTDTFTYSLCNQFGLCDTAQVVVVMNCVAQPIPPVAVEDVASTQRNTPIQIAMLDNDTTNGALTTIEVVTNPTRGTAVVQGNNMLYTPTTDLCGMNDVITYRICNANGCDTAQIVVSVSCGTVNNNANKPVAVDDAYTTDKGVSVTFKATLNDTINGTLTGMNVIVDPRHGAILFRSPDTLIYTPQLGYCGNDTLTYVILNNRGLSDTANIIVTITCTPDVASALPVAVQDVATTPKNRPVTVAVLTNDTLNGTLTRPIVIKTQPNRGVATIVNNDIVYTPQTGQCGFNDTLTYEICNIQGCSTAQVIVTVACPATLPIAIDDNYVTNFNTSIKFSPLTNDNINGVLKSVNVVVTAKHGTVGIVGDSLTYNPATGYCGRDTIQYSITRDDDESDTAFIYVTINCGGARPDAITDVEIGLVNTPATINVLANDATNGTLTKPVTVITQPKRGGVTVDASNNIIYTPIVNACGYTDTLTYEICNANGCDTAEVLVTINCVPTPDARNDVATTSKNRTIDIDVLTNDVINGALDSFKVVTQPTRGTVSVVAGQLRYVPQTDLCGYNDTLTYQICNPNACDTATVIVTVTCDTVALVAPVANYDFGKTPKSTPITLNVLTNDSLYSQVLDSIVVTKQPNHGTVVITQTRQLFYSPDATFCGGNDTLIYKICTVAGCDTALVVINVACDTPAVLPVANVDIDSTLRGLSIAIDVAFNDTLNGADTIRITQTPKHGTASFDIDGYLIYQPDSIFCGGTDSLIYEICSLRGCDTALVLIYVKCDSTGLLFPVALDDSATTQIDSSVVINILDNDISRGGTLQDSLASQPRHGVVLINNGAIFYMPNPGYWGLDTFEYVICNANGCDTARVIVKIDPGSNLTVFNGFSPDGDGMNDYFTIRGIENYPENDVILWNRWGNQVGSVKGYNNADKVWDGTWNGKLVPDGTYFYIINFNDGVTKPVAGYVQIHR
jgi:large repetitive protein